MNLVNVGKFWENQALTEVALVNEDQFLESQTLTKSPFVFWAATKLVESVSLLVESVSLLFELVSPLFFCLVGDSTEPRDPGLAKKFVLSFSTQNI